MSANYSEALESQIYLLRHLHHAARYGSMPEQDEYIIREALAEGHTFFMSREIADALRIASRGFPPTPLVERDVPVPNGFVWLEQPVDQIQAISWTVENRPGFRGIAAVFWLINQTSTYLLSHLARWAFEEVWTNQSRYHKTLDPEIVVMLQEQLRYLGSFFSFVRQAILVAPARQLERHARKRVERLGWGHEPLVRVVELRRKERIGENQPVEPVEREWSCQWVVRGHWRQQPYPKAGAVRPKWITPYVKGPDDKPLKPPRATVFAVVR